MKTVKCAVVGAGWWGTTAHIPALKRHPGAELLAVQSRDPVKARRVAGDFGVKHACTTMEDVLAVEGLEAVIISSTPNMHYPQARAALQQGLHVLIEKPMTLKAVESEELVDLAERRGLHFLVSCPWHYTRHSIEARRLIQSGALGQLKMISVLMSNFTMGLYQGLSWKEIFGRNPTEQNATRPYFAPERTSYSDPAIAGGGQIYCQISHVAAHLGFLTGSAPVSVFAQFDNAGTRVDVYNTLCLRMADGALASIASTGATPMPHRHYEVRIYGTKGVLLLEMWKGVMEGHLFDGTLASQPDLAETEIYPMHAPTENLVDVVAGRAANGSPASLGLYAIRIIDAACESAQRECPVSLAHVRS